MFKLIASLLVIVFCYREASAQSCAAVSTAAIIKEIRDLGGSKYQEKRITYELKSSRALIRDLGRAIKKQHIRLKRALLHELTTPVTLRAAFQELSKLEERLLMAKFAQLGRLRELLSPDERRKLSITIRKYY